VTSTPRKYRFVWWVYLGVVFVHGLIHLMGVTEGLGLADVEQLTEPVDEAAAMLWLLAAVGVVGAGVMTALRARGWWLVTVAAAAVSQVAIFTSWDDAKAGSVVNILMLVAGGYGYTASRDPRKDEAPDRGLPNGSQGPSHHRQDQHRPGVKRAD
jgi:hypothetical protein